jgi:hypothetical protein
MLRYIITRAPGDPLDLGEAVAWESMSQRVDELSGRVGSSRFVTESRRPRAYIATAAGSPGRATYGRGFIVHKINDSEAS